VANVDIAEVRARLNGVAEMLGADGYDLAVEPSGPGVSITIQTTGDACPECLAPERVVRGIIEEKLGDPVPLVQLLYPAPHATTGG
jgi:hypothetical protein